MADQSCVHEPEGTYRDFRVAQSLAKSLTKVVKFWPIRSEAKFNSQTRTQLQREKNCVNPIPKTHFSSRAGNAEIEIMKNKIGKKLLRSMLLHYTWNILTKNPQNIYFLETPWDTYESFQIFHGHFILVVWTELLIHIVKIYGLLLQCT